MLITWQLLQVVMKPQNIDHIPKCTRGKVGEILSGKDERGMLEKLSAELELGEILNRNVQDLSGGELQRFAIAAASLQDANVYMFDEPSSFLDVKQRLKAAQVIRSLLGPKK